MSDEQLGLNFTMPDRTRARLRERRKPRATVSPRPGVEKSAHQQVLDEVAEKRSLLIAKCAAIALELAYLARENGITIGTVRLAAKRAGLITGGETGRTLSWLGAVPRAAGLVATNRTEYNESRNSSRVWVHPDFAP